MDTYRYTSIYRIGERIDLLGIFGDAITVIIHLTHQDLHSQIAGFGLLEGVLEPPPYAIRHHPRQLLPVAAATASSVVLHQLRRFRDVGFGILGCSVVGA